MSRVGCSKIDITNLKECKLSQDKKFIFCQGKVHSFNMEIPNFLEIEIEDKKIAVKFDENNTLFKKKRLKRVNYPMWGTFVRILQQKINGIITGYEKTLMITGTGYRVEKKENILVLKVGLSHLINVKIPQNIEVELKSAQSATSIILKSHDKCLLGDYAHLLCGQRKPNGYSDKGIRDMDKPLIIKEVKKK